MRTGFLERDNVARMWHSNSDGDAYSASFELYPFHEGASYSCYKGLINGEGCHQGRFCVVRAMLDKTADENDWSDLIRRQTEAQRLAREFNKLQNYQAVTFQTPILAKLDTVSNFAWLFRWFKPHDKRLRRDEYVTFEPYLDGPFATFDSQTTSTSVHLTTNSNVTCDVKNLNNSNGTYSAYKSHLNSTSLIQAFSHFTWHFTGNLIVCGLQGVRNGPKYMLTNPVIHSKDTKFGHSDGSTLSIAEFFSNHRCNNICRQWETVGTTGKSQRHVNFFFKSEAVYHGNT